MNGKKIICAGHVCIDITPAVPNLNGAKIEDVLMPGKLVQVGRCSLSVGGVVSNTGLGLKVLGADVSLMGKIGNDAFGALILNQAAFGACFFARQDVVGLRGYFFYILFRRSNATERFYVCHD